MKKRRLALLLALCLCLSGCASMLERSYEASTPHVDKPVADEADDYIRVENYQELVKAILHLVAQRARDGVIRLYDYAGDVESDLSAACLEVATEDPVGAYAVEYIKHDYTRVISYYQAAISIRYRRSQAQMDSMEPVSSTAAIRDRLRESMGRLEDEVVLQVASFSGDEQTITDFVREIYYEDPASALGLPQTTVALYPDSGSRRVVEVLFTWAAPSWELRRRQRALADRVEELSAPALPGEGQAAPGGDDPVLEALAALTSAAAYAPEGNSTPYDALVSGSANDQGLALAYLLLCQANGVDCRLVEGMLGDRPRFWTQVTRADGSVLFLDPAAEAPALYSPDEFSLLGYQW